MKVTFTGRNLVVTPAIQQFTRERLDRLERALEGISDVHVVLVKEKFRHIAEVLVKGKNVALSGTEATEDMYNSIVRALEKIEHQARRRRDKRIDTRRGRGPRKATDGNGARRSVVVEEVVATVSGGRNVVRDNAYPRKPMTAEEAALMVEEDGRGFVVFRDASSQRLGVIYRRDDGHFGLILPEE